MSKMSAAGGAVQKTIKASKRQRPLIEQLESELDELGVTHSRLILDKHYIINITFDFSLIQRRDSGARYREVIMTVKEYWPNAQILTAGHSAYGTSLFICSYKDALIKMAHPVDRTIGMVLYVAP